MCFTDIGRAFLIQAAGASIASGTDISQQTITRGVQHLLSSRVRDTDDFVVGLNIYMGGVGFQQLFVLVFVGLAFTFQRQLSREGLATRQPGVLTLLYVQYAVLALITVSSSYTFYKGFYEADQVIFYRCVSSSDLLNTQAVLQAVFPSMRHISIVSTRYPCSLRWSFSTLSTQAELCLAKRAIYLAEKSGNEVKTRNLRKEVLTCFINGVELISAILSAPNLACLALNN